MVSSNMKENRSTASSKDLDNSSAQSWQQLPKGIAKFLNDEQTCRPVKNIAYAKLAKTGSTAIQGILVRYGIKHNLTFALPQKKNFFPMDMPFNRKMVSWQAQHGMVNFNILASHCIWNMEEIRKLMPPDTIFILSVRKPVDLFVSFYEYSGLQKKSGKNISEFIQKNALSNKYHGIAGYNSMLRGLGVSERDIQNTDIVREQIQHFDKNFDLVLVNEKMNESLVLLRHLLCWKPEDMVTFKVNARRKEFKKALDDEIETLLTKRLQSDILLYKHFNDKMESLIHNFGEERIRAEVADLTEAADEVKQYCEIKETDEKHLQKEQTLWRKEMVVGYSGRRDIEQCKLFSLTEPYLIKYALQKQERRTPPL